MARLLHSTLLCIAFSFVFAENGLKGWLRYAPLQADTYSNAVVPSNLIVLNSSQVGPLSTAGNELQSGLQSIFGQQIPIEYTPSITSSTAVGEQIPITQNSCDIRPTVVVGTVDRYNSTCSEDLLDITELKEDGFWLSIQGNTVQIFGQNERGALYGAFEYLSMVAQGNFSQAVFISNPDAPIRWVNQWDNLDASVERGYGGPSIYFAKGVVLDDLTRAAEYGRILASIGINGIIVNNVNTNLSLTNDRANGYNASNLNATLFSQDNIEGLGRLANAFRPYGVQIGISINFAAPQTIGGLDTFDPLAPSVIDYWANITDKIYESVPDMAGYLVKANSEGQQGPFTYNRSLAEGANLFAKTLKPHNGVLMFRGFVYDQLDESDWKADRANAAVDFFKNLDGQFDDNVVVQIKYGPIDFQVREPTSPLFAHLHYTNTAIELQVAQEYLGQQCHMVYLPPLWKTVLDFDLRVDHEPSLVRDIISGRRFNRTLGGSVAVVNVGTNTTWLGSHMAMSNLYGYGRLAWNPTQDPENILQDWIRLTFGLDQRIIDTVTQISMGSWPAYENYTGNLGVQTLTDLLYTHFGPDPGSADNNGLGQWSRADQFSIGIDRTVANGSGNTAQYPTEVYNTYENIDNTPESLLLWFHHVNYTHSLDSGKTVIQHFYDAHYAGAATAQSLVTQWESLDGMIDQERFDEVGFRLKFQAGHSIVWRDAITRFFYRLSGIPDKVGRVGNYSYRIEAEDMTLSGYEPYPVNPFEAASNSTAIVISNNYTTGSATTHSQFSSGTYDLAVNYFDVIGGRSTWEVFVNNHTIGQWRGNSEDVLGHTPSIYLDGHSAIRITFRDVDLCKGDELKIVGEPDGVEPAPLDYVSVLPQGIVD